MRIVVVCPNDAPPLLLETARLTAWGYAMLVRDNVELRDGMGNCWIVAALAHGAARSLGLKP